VSGRVLVFTSVNTLFANKGHWQSVGRRKVESSQRQEEMKLIRKRILWILTLLFTFVSLGYSQGVVPLNGGENVPSIFQPRIEVDEFTECPDSDWVVGEVKKGGNTLDSDEDGEGNQDGGWKMSRASSRNFGWLGEGDGEAHEHRTDGSTLVKVDHGNTSHVKFAYVAGHYECKGIASYEIDRHIKGKVRDLEGHYIKAVAAVSVSTNVVMYCDTEGQTGKPLGGVETKGALHGGVGIESDNLDDVCIDIEISIWGFTFKREICFGLGSDGSGTLNENDSHIVTERIVTSTTLTMRTRLIQHVEADESKCTTEVRGEVSGTVTLRDLEGECEESSGGGSPDGGSGGNSGR